MGEETSVRSRIIDTHQHFWDVGCGRYSLFQQPLRPRRFGDYRAINKNYLPTDYWRDTADCDVAATIHVEAGYRGPPAEETQWLAKLHGEHGLPSAALIALNFHAEDIPAQIRAHRRAAGQMKIVGIRQHAQWSASEKYTGIKCRELLKSEKLRDGVKAAVDAGLVIELPIYFDQCDDLLALLEAVPQGNFILGHAALPVHLDHSLVPFENAKSGWEVAIRKIAEFPNISIKLSGFWMCGHPLTRSEFGGLIGEIMNTFGPDRCLFGSNFPVDKLFVRFNQMIDTYVACLGAIDEKIIDAVLFENARRIFDLRA